MLSADNDGRPLPDRHSRPASLPPAFGIAVAIGVVFGLYPARRATNMATAAISMAINFCAALSLRGQPQTFT